MSAKLQFFYKNMISFNVFLKRTSFVLAIFFCLFDTAYALKVHTAEYQLSVGGLNSAIEQRKLSEADGLYVYTADAKSIGMLAIFVDYSIFTKSTFLINAKGVDSINYDTVERKNDEIVKNYNIDIDSKDNIVSSKKTITNADAVTWETGNGNVVDLLSLFLALSYELESNLEKVIFDYQVVDGKSIKNHQYKKINNEMISINGKPISVIVVDRVDNNEQTTKVYFSPDYIYLPILIKQKRKGTEYILKMTNLKIAQEVNQQLKIVF